MYVYKFPESLWWWSVSDINLIMVKLTTFWLQTKIHTSRRLYLSVTKAVIPYFAILSWHKIFWTISAFVKYYCVFVGFLTCLLYDKNWVSDLLYSGLVVKALHDLSLRALDSNTIKEEITFNIFYKMLQ